MYSVTLCFHVVKIIKIMLPSKIFMVAWLTQSYTDCAPSVNGIVLKYSVALILLELLSFQQNTYSASGKDLQCFICYKCYALFQSGLK